MQQAAHLSAQAMLVLNLPDESMRRKSKKITTNDWDLQLKLRGQKNETAVPPMNGAVTTRDENR
jgi:hypothetical protein